jgi:hypothetical protein
MTELLDVTNVHPEKGYVLSLEFENGEYRLFDMTYLMDKKPFCRLKEKALFDLATVEYGTVVWPGNIDISPETLYDRSIPKLKKV